MEKTPCIKINEKTWYKIIPYLKEWGYTPDVGAGRYINGFNLLVLDSSHEFGLYNNVNIDCYAGRELIADIEEFLEKAAKLKGFTYKKNVKKEFTKADLKPGMVVEYADKNRRLIVPTDEGLILVGNSEFNVLSGYTDNLKHHLPELNINKVYKIKTAFIFQDLSDDSSILKLIWERNETKEYTMQEIADKFGIPVEQLRIKK